MTRYYLILIVFLLPLLTSAQDYKVTLFGVKSDGKTLNTRSIQKGIDYISENGGGRLVFEVGRYLTGALQLKSNVTIQLQEGAVLVGSTSIYDYNTAAGVKAMVSAEGQTNIGVSGKGVLEGQGDLLRREMNALKERGFLRDSLEVQPALIGFEQCSNITIDSVLMINAGATVQRFNRCNNITIEGVAIKSVSSDAAFVFSNNTRVHLRNAFVEVGGKSLQWEGPHAELRLEKAKDHNGNPLSL